AQGQGTSLLPRLGGQPAAPARAAAYAQHFFPGPRRAAVVLGRWKLALFDRQARYQPPDDYQARLASGELARLPRIGLYDLERDPHERQDLSSLRPDLVARLAAIVHDHLGREVSGLRLLLAGAPAGTVVDVELHFRHPLAWWESCFLGEGDRVVAAGDRLRLTLVGEALPKGVLLPPASEIVSLRVITPVWLPVRLGGGGTYGGGPLGAAAVAHPQWPGAEGPQLLIWLPPGSAAPPPARPHGPEDEGTRRLRALGYVG
ncbi:MAG TPA: hypothetical protein VGV61_17900, partial [Thermoanaerobaculia bacterium]|nr:hypothetical protein [Thermoanaerobaculia bacterium]